MLFEATIVGCLLLGIIIVSLMFMRKHDYQVKLKYDPDDIESNLVDRQKQGDAKSETNPDHSDKKTDKKEDTKTCDPASPSEGKTNPVVPDLRAKPNMLYLDRDNDAQLADWRPDTTSYGPVKLVMRLRNWAFQSFQGQFVQPKSLVNEKCIVVYEISQVGHRDNLVNMFEVCKQLEGRDITPTALYLSDSREYIAGAALHSKYDTVTMGSERFLVLEPLRDRVKDSFASADWKNKESVKRFIRYVLEAVDLIERFHKAGFYGVNLDASSFYIRERDGKVVLGDLWEAEPAYFGGNRFRTDLAAIYKLLDVMDWHHYDHYETDPPIFTHEMKDDLDEIHLMIARDVGWSLHEAPKYAEVRRILEKYV